MWENCYNFQATVAEKPKVTKFLPHFFVKDGNTIHFQAQGV